MNKFVAAALIALVASPALADGSPCEDTARVIAKLEKQKQQGGMSKTEEQNVKSILAAAYETYKANGCK